MKKNYIKMSVVALTFSALMVGCGSSSSVKTTLTKEGIWERKGYGLVVKISQDEKVIRSYDFTRETCLESTSNLMEIQTFFDKAKLSTDKDTLESDNIKVRRVEELPQSCVDNRLITTDTPSNTFKHLWHNFNDYYAFFDERKVDWEAQYSKYEPQISEDMVQEDLFELLSNMLKPINDGHVVLYVDDEISFDTAKDTKFMIAIKQAFSQQTEIEEIDDFISKIISAYNSNLINYFDEESIEAISDEFVIATINSNIGYMKIDSMVEFSEGNEDDDIESIHLLMKKVMERFKDTDGIIIDVRLNSGGHDSVSLAIASYFTDEKKKVYSKQAKYWDGKTEEVDIYIEPSSPSYLKPVIVIGAEETVSAGEIFLMTMGELSNVRLIGENSDGTFSDTLVKYLPNDWEVSLSNEVYYDLSGKKVEVVGIAPDINVSVFSIEALEEGRDNAVETALQLLN
ncbi:MAG: S41 family peptidase [Sulfurovaceae bacterium]|nr:S41 family peptidase [Sulfurovaceae bacterium]